MKKIIFCLIVAIATNIKAAPGAWSQVQTTGIQYLKYEPKELSSSYSLMLSLHGCTQHATDIKALANWEESADHHHMIVVVPEVPNGGVVAGCWDYYGPDQSAGNKHNVILIQMIEDILKNNSNIDPKKVYVSGISAGASQAMLLGCMRPDLFRGVGLNSAAAINTTKFDVFNPPMTVQQLASFCKKLSQDKASFFSGQKTSIIRGDTDAIVSLKHSELILGAMQQIYETKDTRDIDMSQLKGASTSGKGVLYLSASGQLQISSIINNGLGHAWASGSGQGTTTKYFNPRSVNYPYYLGDFFSQP